MLRRFLVLAVICAGLVIVCRANALAALAVCDRSPQPVSFAIATSTPPAPNVQPQTQSQGWWQLDAGTCQIIVSTDLQPGLRYFLYAKSAQITWAGKKSKKSTDMQFCANNNDAFNYLNRTADLCNQADDAMLWFIDESVSGPDWTINLDIPT